MAGKIKYLLFRDGRYYARLVVPKNLREYLGGKTEIRTALGADRQQALRKHPLAVADIAHKISQAERKEALAKGTPTTSGRYPLSDPQIAYQSYAPRLLQDENARNGDPTYALVSLDDGYVQDLRSGIAGTATTSELQSLVGHRIDHFRNRGNTTVETGTAEWRSLARSLCVSEYEALERMLERDEGNYSGTPSNPMLHHSDTTEDALPPVALQDLFSDYIASRKILGKGAESEKRWAPVVKSLRNHVGHNDARRITKKNLISWRDSLLTNLSPKTVSSVYLAAIRTIFNWAVREDRLAENPANNVKQEVPKTILNRPKGYSDTEALQVLSLSRNYAPSANANGKIREYAETTAAKQWGPFYAL